MSDIETNNPELADTLPKNYQEVPNQVLVELIKLLDYKGANGEIKVSTLLIEIKTTEGNNTDLRKFLDMSVSSISGHIAGATYRAGEPGAQATAQSERIRPWSVANRFQAVSQASDQAMVGGEPVPGRLAGIHDVRQAPKYRVGEPVAAPLGGRQD